MPRHSRHVEPDADPAAADQDSVLDDLQQVATDYEERKATWEQDRRALDEARTALDRLEKEKARLETRLDTARKRVADTHKREARQKARADQLVAHLRDIHRALFAGNIYDLILKACLAITGGTRGMYLTAEGAEDRLRVRSAVDMDGAMHGAPSTFIQALCHKVLEDDKTLVCNKETDLSDLPPPEEHERFRNCLVAPVLLLHDFDGVVIVADKPRGEFDEEDVAVLLSIGDQAAVAVQNQRLQREVQRAYLATVTMLADTMEVKDAYTHGHCALVSRLARLTAEQMRLAEAEQRVVCYTALLHDIGKIGVSDGILNKPGPLLPEEWELMRAHVRIGHDLVAKLPALAQVGQAVLRHHERFDGTGYPDGLRGEAIPVAARIVAVVDAYCAMITKRSYKEAYSVAKARAELERCAGTQFDPTVVAAFLTILDSPEAQEDDADEDDGCGPLPGLDYDAGLALRPTHSRN